jgi:hypothetical protein
MLFLQISAVVIIVLLFVIAVLLYDISANTH